MASGPRGDPKLKGGCKMEKDKEDLTQIRFEIVVAMLNEDPKLFERLKVYVK